MEQMLFQALFRLCSSFSKKVSWYYGSTVLTHLFLNLEEGECDKNDEKNLEILLHFETAIAAE